jgi:hypothetical protein
MEITALGAATGVATTSGLLAQPDKAIKPLKTAIANAALTAE